MEYRAFGRTGLTVSALGFGCGSVGGLMVRGPADLQLAAVGRAIEAGVTYFDTAAAYGDGRSEEALGRALTSLGAWDSVVVGTKLRLDDGALADPYPEARASLVRSLSRLGRDHVDLIQLHNQLGPGPRGGGIDGERAVAVGAAMRRLVSDGLARHIGFTGMGDTSTVHAAAAGAQFESMQAYFNALNPSAGYGGASGGSQDFAGAIDVASAAGKGVIAIRVMASGALVGHEERTEFASPVGPAMVPGSGYSDDVTRAQRLAGIAGDAGLESTVELGYRFALSKQGVSTALVGFSNTEQLEAAIRWAERGALPATVVEAVVQAAR